MHICICKAHLQMLRRSLLPCPRQKATPEVAAPRAPMGMVRAPSGAAQPGTRWWVARAALVLPCLPVSGLATLPLKLAVI